MERLAFGALAGLSATMAMTAAMRHLWPSLEPQDRYPLPPREIVEDAAPPAPERSKRLLSVLAHFGFGAVVGAAYALLPERRRNGVVYGLTVWAASYLGWLPGLGILKPATEHPAERNLLMIAVHVVWGGTLAAALNELERSADEVFASGRAPDAKGEAQAE
ncbi:DUF1440 domain-containing protein [Nitratireductor sp. GCM10026969]|uniref:DUF1440 domain-containing protein n=1 Tax=Nitratireductor sp. GCM10026969 TaxID=3252645 RepID=UPI00360F9492